MCVIAIQPRGIQISRDYLENCWDNNNHGAGIMYAVNGKIIVKKELKSFDTFMEYVNIASQHDTSVVIHFRIATSGGINDYNCHPFKVHKNLYFCHNGILDIQVPHHSKENDTQIFNNTLMKPLPYNFYKNNAIMNVLEWTIGTYNKFVFLDDVGDYYILNESAGEWSEEGAWFSNTSYKRAKYTYNPSNYDWVDKYKHTNKLGTTTYSAKDDIFDDEYNKISDPDIDSIDDSLDGLYGNCMSCDNYQLKNTISYIREYDCDMCMACRADFEVGEYAIGYEERLMTDDLDAHIVPFNKYVGSLEDDLIYD